MNQEQRIWIASILSAVVMITYLQATGKQLRQQIPAVQSSTPTPSANINIAQQLPEEQITTIESSDIRLQIGRKSASVRAVELKKFHKVGTTESLGFGNRIPVLSVIAGAEDSAWTETGLGQAPSWKKPLPGGQEATLTISSQHPSVYIVTVSVNNPTGVESDTPVRILASWNRGDQVGGRSNILQAILRTNKSQGWQREYLTYYSGHRGETRVPRGTRLVTLSDRFFCQSIRPQDSNNSVSILPSTPDLVVVSIDGAIKTSQHSQSSYIATVYSGPRDFFIMRDAGFDGAFHIGFLGQIGLMLVLFLKAIASVVHNYGVAIVILGAIVTVTLSPFTLISFRSMKKMQELQPAMDRLKKKHEKDPAKLNQEMMALFKENRVSPLSGCLPMFIQMPIFFALWSAISHVIEFRGERFLWIKDLSLPDRIAKLPMGIDLNILPILMAISMYFQTKITQGKTSTTNTTMFSGPMMSIMFGFMFYSVPSSLVLYWLTNSLISVAWYSRVQ